MIVMAIIASSIAASIFHLSLAIARTRLARYYLQNVCIKIPKSRTRQMIVMASTASPW